MQIMPNWKKLQKRLKNRTEEPPVPEGMIDGRDEAREIVENIQDGVKMDEEEAGKILRGLMQKAIENPGVPVVIAAGRISTTFRSLVPSLRPKKEEPKPQPQEEPKEQGKKVSPELKAIRAACEAAAKRMSEGK